MSAASRIKLFLIAFCVFSANAAYAQPSAYCDRLRTELSAVEYSLNNSANTDSAASIKKTLVDLNRTITYSRSIGCQDARIPLLSAPPPAQCPSLEAQIGRLEANLNSLQQEASRSIDGGLQQRRNDLKAGIEQSCNADGSAKAQPKGLLETLFGAPASTLDASEMPDGTTTDTGDEFAGGYRTICVRTCDGFYFPIRQRGSSLTTTIDADLCQASCPSAEVKLYLQPLEKDVDTAVSVDGTANYTALPNAFRYRTSLEPTCGCRPADKSWADTLAAAEQILGVAGETDGAISELKAQELSRPRELKAQKPNAKSKTPNTQPQPDPAQSAPVLQNTAQANLEIIPLGKGEFREVTGSDGIKRRVRVLVVPATDTP